MFEKLLGGTVYVRICEWNFFSSILMLAGRIPL
jgi:hypothetical protein